MALLAYYLLQLLQTRNLELSAYLYNEYKWKHPTLYFEDGQRKIGMLTYLN